MTKFLDELEGALRDVSGRPQEIWETTLYTGKEKIEKLTQKPLGMAQVNRLETTKREGQLSQELYVFLIDLANAFNLQIPIVENASAQENIAEFERFARNRKADALISRLVNQSTPVTESAGLPQKTKDKILSLTSSLKDQVTNLNVSQSKKKSLAKKIESFEIELEREEVSFSRLLTALAVIGAAVAGTTSVLADGPAAIETIGKITALIGYEAADERDQKLLEMQPPLLQLPPPDEKSD